MNKKEEEKLVGVEDVAKYFDVHPRTIDRWIKTGKLRAYAIPSKRVRPLFKMSEVKRQLGMI